MDNTTSKIKQADQENVSHTYARFDVVLTHGKGAVCYDEQGKKYVDFTSGIGVNSLGFCNDRWSDAVAEQARTLQHISNLYYTKPNATLAKKLCERTGYKKVFFGNSGAEANEGAIKIARKYGADTYGQARTKICTLVNSFHGRTVTTLAATGQDSFHQKFYPLTPGFDYILANDLADLSKKLDDTVCAVMLEFIQGEGGVVPLEPDFVDAIKKICVEKDILIIADEVQTGVGRTGTFLASEQYGLLPNITTLAKGLGGGLPIGAVLTDAKTADVLQYGDHGSTFGGNPLSCAGANVVLAVLDDAQLEQVRQNGVELREALSSCAEVESITGLGMMVGIKLKTKTAKDVANACLANGLLVLTAKEKVRLLPPLTISAEELNAGLCILKRVLED